MCASRFSCNPCLGLQISLSFYGRVRTGLEAAVLFVQQGFPRPSSHEGAIETEQEARDVATVNTETFCAIFRGLMDPVCSIPIESVTEYAQVSNLMQAMDVIPGPRIVALGLRRYLQDGELDLVRI